ncbi:MAG: hypothetical protein K5930_05430 [Treponemataceae bacterium]|nr:hypothetical protein [Treponemataceae bacterium]
MKILSIELKNINSLAGEWKIDFTDPSFLQNHNFFVVFGDTGAGKSSILDAVTLALYGRTPRQDRINNNHNEVMTRNTATCFARLKYKCRRGIFISEWRQKRAKEKISGKLQDPEFLITYENGRVYEEGKAARLADLTQGIIDLDYKQFVRSIILAQGEFSRFLDCKPNERAEILEKLDGSDKYRKIAIAIANRTDQEESLFNDKKKDVELIRAMLLSPEDVEQKKLELTDLALKKSKLEDKLEELRKYKQWYDSLDEKKRQVEAARSRLSALEEEIHLFLPSENRLKKGEDALLCEASYSSLYASRSELKKDSDSLKAASEGLSKAEEGLSQCKKRKEDAAEKVSSYEKERVQLETLWKEVEALDIRINEAEAKVASAAKNHETALEELSSAENELTEKKERHSVLSKNAVSYELYKKDNACDCGIGNMLSGLEEKKKRLGVVSLSAQEYEKQEKLLLPELSALDQRKEELDKEIKEKEKYISDNKKDGDLAEKIHLVKTLCEALDSQETSLAVTEEKLAGNEKDILEKKKELEKLRSSKLSILSELETVFADDALFIADELQKRLKAGEPCPVCGSLEHPACEGSGKDRLVGMAASAPLPEAMKRPDIQISVMERTSAFAEKVRDMRSQADAVEKALQNAERDSLLLEKDKANLTEKKESLLREVTETKEKLLGLVSPWIPSSDEMGREELFSFLEKKSAAYRSCESSLVEFKEAFNFCNVEFLDKKKDFDNNTSALAVSREEKDKLIDEIKGICKPFMTKNDFSPFTEMHSGKEELLVEDLFKSLQERAELWDEKSQKLEEIERAMTELASEEKALTEKLKLLEKKEKEEASELSVCNSSLSALQAERKASFGEMEVEESHRLSDEKMSSLRSELKESEDEDVKAQLLVSKYTTSVGEYKERIETHKEKMLLDEKSFLSKLSEAGFTSEEDFLSHKLDKNSLEDLRKKSKELRERKISAESSVQDSEKSLKAHESLYGDIPSFEEVGMQLEAAESELETATADLARINAELESDEKSRKESNERIKEFEAQKAIYDKWIRLKALMGNKDGSSFSVFVQGITFRHLLTLANRHLALMKDRYTLVPKDDMDFEINDASFSSPRSVSNISGGERFLISLALALGIADLASRTVRVDSLFLDEGFGSLDGETLRSVLDCLKRQQQKEGKMLGIITHVDAVVDSVEQKIEVKPVAGGHSIIRGKGISRKG